MTIREHPLDPCHPWPIDSALTDRFEESLEGFVHVSHRLLQLCIRA